MNGVEGRLLVNIGGGANVCRNGAFTSPPPDCSGSKRGRFTIRRRQGCNNDRSTGLLALCSTSRAGLEGVDDDTGDDNDKEAEVVEAAYFRLLMAVGALRGFPAFTERPLASTLFNGSGMNLSGFSTQNHGSTRPRRRQDKQGNNASGPTVHQTKELRV